MTTFRDHDITCAPATTPAHPQRRRAVSVLLAAAGALGVWLVAHPIAGVDLVVGKGDSARTVGLGAVVFVSIAAGLAAVGLAVLLGRRARRPRSWWTAIAAATLIASLTGPLGAATLAAGVSLAAMHLVVGATLILGIGGTLQSTRMDA